MIGNEVVGPSSSLEVMRSCCERVRHLGHETVMPVLLQHIGSQVVRQSFCVEAIAVSGQLLRQFGNQ